VYGYRVHFNGNSTVSVYRVDKTYRYYGNPDGTGWEYERHIIEDDDPYATYTISDSCPVIFVEDKVWLEGAVNQTVTLAAADVDSSGVDPSIILNGNTTYTSATSSGLLAIAEADILVGVVVPDDMVTNGIYIAQNGWFARNHYSYSYLPYAYRHYYERDSHT